MKAIDLLNKIANGEEVPKKFIFSGYKYEKSKKGRYVDEDGDYLSSNICYDFSNLNDKVEIIEEDKKIEDKKIEKLDITDTHYMIDHQEIMNKINEIIDKLNAGVDKE